MTSARYVQADPDPVAHAWKSRTVLWGYLGGVWHVTTRAATVGWGIQQVFACGAETGMWGIEAGTWYGMKNDGKGRKLCRKCVGKLAEAGGDGAIGGR
jgi:hypothetical protein